MPKNDLPRPPEHGILLVCESAFAFASTVKQQATAGRKSEDDFEIIRRCLHRLSTKRIRNREDAEDLVQETLLTFSLKRPEAVLRKGLLPWCSGVLRRKVGNYYRRANSGSSRARRAPAPLKWTDFSSEGFSPETQLLRKELQLLLARLVAQLPPRERKPIELLIDGQRPGEVAERLRPARYQSVINRIYRGRKRLSQGLASYGFSPVHQSRK